MCKTPDHSVALVAFYWAGVTSRQSKSTHSNNLDLIDKEQPEMDSYIRYRDISKTGVNACVCLSHIGAMSSRSCEESTMRRKGFFEI